MKEFTPSFIQQILTCVRYAGIRISPQGLIVSGMLKHVDNKMYSRK
jgi:hypothetical protein